MTPDNDLHQEALLAMRDGDDARAVVHYPETPPSRGIAADDPINVFLSLAATHLCDSDGGITYDDARRSVASAMREINTPHPRAVVDALEYATATFDACAAIGHPINTAPLRTPTPTRLPWWVRLLRAVPAWLPKRGG